MACLVFPVRYPRTTENWGSTPRRAIHIGSPELPPDRMHWMAEGLTQAMRAADMTASAIYRTVLEHLGPDRTVVDVGAGVGRFAIPLAQAGCRVWAVEPAPLMREYLTQHLQQAGSTAEPRITVIPDQWPTPSVPRVEVALSTYVLQLADDPVAFARAMDQVATRQVIIALHIDPMPMAELTALFQSQPTHYLPRFRQIYPILLDGGIYPDVRVMAEVQHPRFDTPAWTEQMITRLQLQDDPDGQARLRAWIAEKTREGSLSRPHRFALLTWTPGER